MRKKHLGRTDIEVPVVGLGTGHIGLRHQNHAVAQYSGCRCWEQQADLDLAIETVIAAIEAGVRLIDTSPFYGRGGSEIAIGKALSAVQYQGLRDEMVICTKIGHLYSGDYYAYRYDDAMRSFE